MMTNAHNGEPVLTLHNSSRVEQTEGIQQGWGSEGILPQRPITLTPHVTVLSVSTFFMNACSWNYKPGGPDPLFISGMAPLPRRRAGDACSGVFKHAMPLLLALILLLPASGVERLIWWMMMASISVAAVSERPLVDGGWVLPGRGWCESFWKAARMAADPWLSASLLM